MIILNIIVRELYLCIMLLVCIDNKQIPGRLTVGKEYEVINKMKLIKTYVWILSDDGETRAYLSRRFAFRSDLRSDSLNNLGI